MKALRVITSIVILLVVAVGSLLIGMAFTLKDLKGETDGNIRK